MAAAAPQHIGVPQEDGYTTIFGYGSLMSQRSARKSMPNAKNFRPALLQGWRRVFSLISLNRIKRGVTRAEDSALAAVAVRRGHPSDVLWGVLLDVPDSEVPAYKEREARYVFTTADCLDLGSAYGAFVPALVCVESSDAAYKADPSRFPQTQPAHDAAWASTVTDWYDPEKYGPLWGRPDLVPAGDYLRLCLGAAAELGGEAWCNFLACSYLVDGTTTLGEHLLARPDIAPHPSWPEGGGGLFAFLGVTPSASAAGEWWPQWWAGSGGDPGACPALLPLDMPLPGPTAVARDAYKVRMSAFGHALRVLPGGLLRGCLITAHKTAVHDALAGSVQLHKTAAALKEVSTVTRWGNPPSVSLAAVASDPGAMESVLGAALEAWSGDRSPPLGSTSLDLGPAWSPKGGARSFATLWDATPLPVAPSCMVAGAEGGLSALTAHWTAYPSAEVLILGAGGAGVALAAVVTDTHRGKGVGQPAALPAAVHLLDPSPPAQTRAAAVLSAAWEARYGPAAGGCKPTVYAAASPGAVAETASALLRGAGPGSLVVNASGLGKDVPGDPLHPEGGAPAPPIDFPASCIVWELNYRGERPFLATAVSAVAPGALVMDGWRLFHTGWSRVAAAAVRAAKLHAATT